MSQQGLPRYILVMLRHKTPIRSVVAPLTAWHPGTHTLTLNGVLVTHHTTIPQSKIRKAATPKQSNTKAVLILILLLQVTQNFFCVRPLYRQRL
ncbi:hypothetical protein E2C01_081208 [Portunus trituberculatus]|uniref:Uncharacterized protein n=1 Tax=Portunus trituberculatus TaxID=210409 RepID=A0A5B7IVN3_PORTR|nr:hypothetical protein [Portunus trituberculatus]